MAAILDLGQYGRLRGAPVLAPGKNQKGMLWAASGPNLVLLEEFEPNTPD